jgi:hypothetical protein
MLHNSKPNISLITYFWTWLSTTYNTTYTKRTTKEIKHPLTLGHSIFLDFRWIVGELGFLNMLCIWIFPTMKQ